ncbi:hypothetical protein BDR03DRAFT_1014464 [Suillus americanus]|nr:hypothetical protein BDR03DRAFT_1014464 [Suillus americanus]
MTDRDYVVTGHGTNKEAPSVLRAITGARATMGAVVLVTITLTSSDGSFYYQNRNGSKYYDNGAGEATYTTSDGHVVKLQK